MPKAYCKNVPSWSLPVNLIIFIRQKSKELKSPQSPIVRQAIRLVLDNPPEQLERMKSTGKKVCINTPSWSMPIDMLVEIEVLAEEICSDQSAIVREGIRRYQDLFPLKAKR